MKTIGMIGGMSWESTLSYYKAINEEVKNALGGLHSAKIILNSVNFHEIEVLQHQNDWRAAAKILIDAAISVERGGADVLIICTNTMHKVFAEVEAAVSIPLLHIADATALALQNQNVSSVGLLGTRFTMEEDFYKGRLQHNFGIDVLIPDREERELIHRVIYDELCLGTINPVSREKYLETIKSLAKKGANAIILGCTEIALLVEPQHTEISLFDTTAIHAKSAVKIALGK